MKYLVYDENLNELVETEKRHEENKAFDQFRETLGCSLMQLGGCVDEFDIWCDEEGLLTSNYKMINHIHLKGGGKIIIAGNFIVAKTNEDGETLALTDEEIERFKEMVTIEQVHPLEYIEKSKYNDGW